MTNRKVHPALRLAFIDGERVSLGYKSGRSRCRETPVIDSTARTRSAGTVPRDIQLETVLCAPSPSCRARAVCPPTALQAAKSAFKGVSSIIAGINAQTVDRVNADTGNPATHTVRMSKRTVLPASAFWMRLEQALAPKWAPMPFNANSVAKKLKLSQGTTHRWYTGIGLPELKLALDLAKEGGVCIDWLLNNVKPKHPISNDPVLQDLFETCEELEPEGRERVLRAARGELLQQQGDMTHGQQTRIGTPVRRAR